MCAVVNGLSNIIFVLVFFWLFVPSVVVIFAYTVCTRTFLSPFLRINIKRNADPRSLSSLFSLFPSAPSAFVFVAKIFQPFLPRWIAVFCCLLLMCVVLDEQAGGILTGKHKFDSNPQGGRFSSDTVWGGRYRQASQSLPRVRACGSRTLFSPLPCVA